MAANCQPTLFISYARADDESFARKLAHDLGERGCNVWWDRDTMDSRGRSFLQEIRDAIAGVDRLILVVGPASATSEYVRAEWEYAFAMCKVVTPILRLGNFSLAPEAVSAFHMPDFREERPYDDALVELLRIVTAPIPTLGPLYGIEQLPAVFLPRPEPMLRLSAAVLADLAHPGELATTQRITVLHGMGGVGKSVLAAAFAQSCNSRRVFGDGVVWLRFGPNSDPAAELRKLGTALAGVYKLWEVLCGWLPRRAIYSSPHPSEE